MMYKKFVAELEAAVIRAAFVCTKPGDCAAKGEDIDTGNWESQSHSVRMTGRQWRRDGGHARRRHRRQEWGTTPSHRLSPN